MAALNRVNRLVHRLHRRENPLRRERVFRDRTNPLDTYNDTELFLRFRFPRRELLELIDEFEDEITHLSTRQGTLSAAMQMLIALRFYASGTFQIIVGDLFGVSKATVHRCIKRVSAAIAGQIGHYVRFDAAPGEIHRTKRKFYAMANFPNIIGCIDCTHVRIQAPSVNEHEYVNRKGWHSLNIQLVCDADLRVHNAVVRWPGSVHDARILRQSAMFPAFEANPPAVDGVVLGDGGYMLRPWLLTPYVNPNDNAKRQYNFAHSSTRSTIERCNGVLKRRWHSLHGELR